MKTTSRCGRECHVPTLRCHQEVMTKLSPCNSGLRKVCSPTIYDSVEQRYCLGVRREQINSLKENRVTKNKPKSKKDAPVRLKSEGKLKFESSPIYESMPMRSNGKRSPCSQSERSKSVPLVADSVPNFENSVDFIPVKLTAKDTDKTNLQKVIKTQKKSSGSNKKCVNQRTTWSDLLKQDGQDLFQSNDRSETTNEDRPKALNLKTGVYSKSNLQKKKVAISISNKNCDYNGDSVSSIRPNTKLSCFPESENKPFDSVADPIKTLDFLIKQLRDRLMKQPENDNLQKIIIDMENALLKISYDNQPPEKIDIVKNMPHTTNFSSPSNAVPNSAAYPSDNIKQSGSHQMSLETNPNKNKLEESCFYLQSLCLKQRENINKNICEQEQLTIQLAESRRLLAVAKTREKDYEITIGELRLKIQESASKIEKQNENIQFLNDTILKLRTENEILLSYKDSIRKLSTRLKEISRENEILNSKLSTKDLEIEKLKVLLDVKDSCHPQTVPKNIITNQNLAEKDMDLVNIPIEDDEKDIVSSMSLSSVTTWVDDKALIACSSQASGSPRHSPSPYNSWQYISSIQEHPLSMSTFGKDIGNIFHSLKQKNELTEPDKLNLELPSSNDSSWSDKDNHDNDSKPGLTDIDSEMLSS